jgi:hypothetical protein
MENKPSKKSAESRWQAQLSASFLLGLFFDTEVPEDETLL